MKGIKLITDTACDIPDDALRDLNIDMLYVPMVIDGIGFFERKSFSFDEYYQVLNKAIEIPKTSRVSQMDYLSCYEKNYLLGFRHLVVVSIASVGSGTMTSAIMARDEFFQLNPQAEEKCTIHIVDSKTYSVAYGWAVMESAKMAIEGKSIEEVLDFLDEWINNVKIYLGCFTLDYAKKSGRISTAAAFLGEMLGMRPIILMEEGITTTLAKVRGNNKVVSGIFSQYEKNDSKEDTLLIVVGEDPKPGEELQKMLKKDTKTTIPIFKAGASIVTNAGPNMIALVVKPSSANLS